MHVGITRQFGGICGVWVMLGGMVLRISMYLSQSTRSSSLLDRMWWEQGLDDQKHHDRMGTSCFDDEFGGDEVMNMDEHENSFQDKGETLDLDLD